MTRYRMMLAATVVAMVVGLAVAVPMLKRRAAGDDSPKSFFRHSVQAGAQSVLFAAYTKLHEANSFETAMDADHLFGDLASLCPPREPCGHYIYAVQASCEAGGAWSVSASSWQMLAPELRGRGPEIQRWIQTIGLACLPAAQRGFHLLAVGVIETDDRGLDVWTLDQRKDLRGEGVEF